MERGEGEWKRKKGVKGEKGGEGKREGGELGVES